MASVKFSNAGLNASIDGSQAGALFSGTGTTAVPATLSGGATNGSTLLLIYQGQVPSFSTLTDRSTRASDLLITFSLPLTTNSYSNLGIVGTSRRFICGVCNTATAATASGTATWFLLCRAGTTSLTDKGAMMGTVGGQGSGADLEIASTNIISGNNYISGGLYLNFPQVWNF